MSPNHTLNAEEDKELEMWLDLKQIHLNHRTRRHLSDVVNMAQLYKNILGKYVDLKNYTSHGNFELKLLNWEAFNLKVLRRTGKTLNRSVLVQLSNGDLEALKYILFHLMRIEKNSVDGNSDVGVLSPTRAFSQPDPVEYQQPARDKKPVQMMGRSDESPPMRASGPTYRGEFKSKQRKLSDRIDETTIRMLIEKVQYYQDVVQEKDKRIDQLLSHLSKFTSRIMGIQSARKAAKINSKTAITEITGEGNNNNQSKQYEENSNCLNQCFI